jgi:hypothetical protein
MQQRLRLALAEVGITTVRELNAALSDRGFARQVRRYALLSGVGEGEASHLAILALLLQSKAPDLFEVFFPEFANDLPIQAARSSR